MLCDDVAIVDRQNCNFSVQEVIQNIWGDLAVEVLESEANIRAEIHVDPIVSLLKIGYHLLDNGIEQDVYPELLMESVLSEGLPNRVNKPVTSFLVYQDKRC